MSGKIAIAEPSAIAIGWSFQTQIDERRILTAQTHVPADADPEQISRALDKIADQLDRMEARYRARQLERQLVQEKRLREEATKAIDRVEKKAQEQYAANPRRAPMKLSQTEESAKQNLESTISRHDLIIGDVERDLSDCRRMLNGAGA
jgi:paraquat-inducible protein B